MAALRSQISSLLDDESLENKVEAKDVELQLFKTAFFQAEAKYRGEIRIPFFKSKLNKGFGFFSWARHGQIPEQFKQDLLACTNGTETRDLSLQFLRARSRFADPKVGNVHSFSQYYLEEIKWMLSNKELVEFFGQLRCPFKYAVTSATIKYENDSWEIGKDSYIGCVFAAPKPNEEKMIAEFKEKVETCADNAGFITIAIEHLTTYGCLWDAQRGLVHSFTSYWLTSLRVEDINTYKKIIGTKYNISFLPNDREITLYRNDTRAKAIIFAEGFQFKEDQNSPAMRKGKYFGLGRGVTNSTGISCSKAGSNPTYGSNLYEIRLPKGHQFLIIDVAQSSCNSHMESQQKALQEANSCDPLPSQSIFSCESRHDK